MQNDFGDAEEPPREPRRYAGESSRRAAEEPNRGPPPGACDGKPQVAVSKTVQQVAAWVRDLPPRMVPDEQREALARAVEAEGLSGTPFNSVATQPAELAKRGVPSPAHALKIRKAWEQVVQESVFAQAAANAAGPKVQKGVKMDL